MTGVIAKSTVKASEKFQNAGNGTSLCPYFKKYALRNIEDYLKGSLSVSKQRQLGH